MSDDAKSFVVYDDIKDVLDELTDEQVGQLFRGMVNYHSEGKDPKFAGILKYVFIPIKQGMDRNADKYAKKCERLRENANKRYNKGGDNSANASNCIQLHANAGNTNTITNTISISESESNTNTMSTGVDVWELSLSVITHLNDKAGTLFKADDVKTVQLISDLAHRGYTEEDMIRVVDVKVSDWIDDPKVRQHIRPSVLFGENFEEYLAQPLPEKLVKQKRAQQTSTANAERADAFRSELEAVRDKIKEADTKTRIQLKEREAWLEDEIRRLTS